VFDSSLTFYRVGLDEVCCILQNKRHDSGPKQHVVPAIKVSIVDTLSEWDRDNEPSAMAICCPFDDITRIEKIRSI